MRLFSCGFIGLAFQKSWLDARPNFAACEMLEVRAIVALCRICLMLFLRFCVPHFSTLRAKACQTHGLMPDDMFWLIVVPAHLHGYGPRRILLFSGRVTQLAFQGPLHGRSSPATACSLASPSASVEGSSFPAAMALQSPPSESAAVRYDITT